MASDARQTCVLRTTVRARPIGVPPHCAKRDSTSTDSRRVAGLSTSLNTPRPYAWRSNWPACQVSTSAKRVVLHEKSNLVPQCTSLRHNQRIIRGGSQSRTARVNIRWHIDVGQNPAIIQYPTKQERQAPYDSNKKVVHVQWHVQEDTIRICRE